MLSDRISGGGKDVAEQVINNMRMAHSEVMVSFWNGMGGSRAVKREDLIRRTVDMDQGLGRLGILPFQDRIDGPGNKSAVAGPDDFAHDLPIAVGSHGKQVIDGGQEFHQCWKSQFR